MAGFLLSDGLTPRERLLLLRERGNKAFACSLHPGVENVLGLRVPDVRVLAAEIAAGDWREYLSEPGDFYMEERMLHGFVLGSIRGVDADEYLALVERFVAIINSWSVCDTFDFAGKAAFVRRNRAKVGAWLENMLGDEREYVVRFAVVMLMKYFIGGSGVGHFLDCMARVSHRGYYVRMAVAWALSVAYVKFPDIVYGNIVRCTNDDFTLGRTISKICDSYRVSPEDKARARALRSDKKRN